MEITMDSQFYYTNERNVQIVIALLKAHGIHRIIVSPGTTNMTFVVSIQNDPWFQIWSSVDERSAAYLACGMAAETGESVVISCTGATASRNYMPGLTEAYYRKLPVLAITSTRGNYKIGHLIDQQIDRRTLPNDIAMESVTIPMVKDWEDEHYCEIEVNKAILALRLNGGGPAHINLCTTYSHDFSLREIPHVNAIYRHTLNDQKLPEIPNGGRIAIFVGSHPNFTKQQILAIDKFCSTYDAVVFCDHTSGYRGKYEINGQIVLGQKNYKSPLTDVNLCIHIGEVSGDQFHIKPKNTWRVSPDGALRDTFGSLRRVFMMPEESFFEYYSIEGQSHTEYLDALTEEINLMIRKLPELPFGNIWMAQQMVKKLPEGCELHLGIYNSLRSWNFFKLPKDVYAKCNVGGFGIDGGVSTMIGASITNPERLFIGIFGDLAFFYDINVVGNRHVGCNVRIMVINNGRGTEFRNYNHPCYFLGEVADEYIAAAGHYGNQSKELLKHYATDLGYKYMSASNKEEFHRIIDFFLNPDVTDSPILFEVFTDQNDESEALKQILNIVPKPMFSKQAFSQQAKCIVKKVIGENVVKGIRLMISNK